MVDWARPGSKRLPILTIPTTRRETFLTMIFLLLLLLLLQQWVDMTAENESDERERERERKYDGGKET